MLGLRRLDHRDVWLQATMTDSSHEPMRRNQPAGTPIPREEEVSDRHDNTSRVCSAARFGIEAPLMPRVALVTGASRGIGAATALILAERGFRVVVNHRDSAPQAEQVVTAVKAAGGEAVAVRADVTMPADIAALVGETNDTWGSVDVLVHNALIP